jgi:two-component system response regulator TctD
VVPRERLFAEVFRLDDDAGIEAIDVYIHRVRKKLDALAAGGVTITTLRGLGYVLQQAAA